MKPLLRAGAAAVVGTAESAVRAYRRIARFHYRARFLACGEDVVFDPLTSNIAYEHVRLGSRVYIGPGATIGRADIGDDVMLGPNVSIRDSYHAHEVVGRSVRDSGDRPPGRVSVGSDVWIGEGATLLGRARVPDGVVIGTKAVVNDWVPPYTVVVGDPARAIERRFGDQELREHLRRRGVPHARIAAIIEERAAALDAGYPVT
jgi:acetyltransferase-like isoleucine patch superfamily enzyme